MCKITRALGWAGIGFAACMAGTAAAGTAAEATSTQAVPDTAIYPASANGEGRVRQGYALSRWTEDWRPLSQTDPEAGLDGLKYLRLDSAPNVYLTLSGEARYRFQQITNPNLREGPTQQQERWRVFAGADLHLGSRLRAYAEVATASVDGTNLGVPNANIRNDLAVQQAFVEAQDEIAGKVVGLRAGRQEFTDGPNLLTSSRDDNTLRFVLDGVRGWVRSANARIDVFDYRYVRYGSDGLADDETDPSRRFSGATFGYVVPRSALGGSRLFFDPFIWRLRNRAATWGADTAREERLFYGVHLYGDVGPVALDWTINRQDGRFDDRPIDAWQAFIAQTYRLGSAASAPRIGVHFDYGSGGGAYGGGALKTASGLFGNNIYYSYQLSLTPTNLTVLAPNASFQPVRNVRVTGEYAFAWRPAEDDAVYRASGAAFAGTQNASGHRVADVLRLQVVWTATPRFNVTGRYERLIARDALTGAGYADSDFVALWAGYRF